MSIAVGRDTIETIPIRSISRRAVADLLQLLYSEYHVTVDSVETMGWGRRRRHMLTAERFSPAARRYLDKFAVDQPTVGRHRTTGAPVKQALVSARYARTTASALADVNRRASMV